MLKRRRRIQKYIKALKNKKRGLVEEDVDKLKIEDEEEEKGKREVKVIKVQNNVPSIHTKLTFQTHSQSQTQNQALWQDEDEGLQLPSRNAFKKLQLDPSTTQTQYQQRLRTFYNSKNGLHNWAVEGQGENEQDINDLLNHEEVYAHALKKKEHLGVQFMGRSTQKHASVVTGLDWKGQVLATSGYDQKLKLWSVRTSEQNPQLRIKLQKDVYVEGFSLSNCHFKKQSIVLGTLRQNYIQIDCNKWKINKVSSSFLNVHPTFQHLRLNKQDGRVALFSGNNISLLDRAHSYQGALLANQSLEDVQFAGQHRILGISKDCLFQWDLRMWRLANRYMTYNGFTRLWSQDDTVAIGNRLGVVSLATLPEQLKQYAQINGLVTHVTDLKGNQKGDLLVECSKWKANAVRLIDVQQGRIISGWPAVNTKLGLPTVAGFSQTNQLAIANSQGYFSLYGLNSQ